MTATLATRSLTTADVATVLFTASLACGDMPTEGRVMETIKTTIVRFGVAGCVATMAGEFGEHPEVAVVRMARARELAAQLPTITIEL